MSTYQKKKEEKMVSICFDYSLLGFDIFYGTSVSFCHPIVFLSYGIDHKLVVEILSKRRNQTIG